MFKKNNFQIIELMDQTIWDLLEVKNYMRIPTNDDDNLIKSLIDAAITAAENFTKLTIMSKRIKFICNIEGQKNFPLKYHPLKELVKITVRDQMQESELCNYYIDHNNSVLCLDKTLVNVELIVEYVAGFCDNNIPQSIKHGILLHVAEMYDRCESNSAVFSATIKNLYLPYRQLKI